jgi:ABC-type bacteriocin/lantibiotic exporter with double-glycine peptidase domain
MSILELQRTKADCGVAALRAALSFFGIKASYRAIYKLAETSNIGTDSKNILKVLEYYKLNFEVRQTYASKTAYEQLTRSPYINILCIDNFNHWVVKICTHNDMTVIFDPEYGTMVLTKRQLLNRWVASSKETYAIGIWSADESKTRH